MIISHKRLAATALVLTLMFAAVMPATAHERDRGISTKQKVVFIGGGAAAGALLGGLLKGKKGAVIGGLIGAGAGAGYSYLKDRRERDRSYRSYDVRGRYYDDYRGYNTRSYSRNCDRRR